MKFATTPEPRHYALAVVIPQTEPARRVMPRFLQAKPRPLSAVAAHLAGSALPPAVVCEVGWVNGLGAIRSLGRAGVPVVALDHRPWALGFRSRYALPVVAPDPLPDENGFISFLQELAEVVERPMPIFPTHDEHLNSLARRRDELGDSFLCPFPGWEVLEPLQSKRHQIATAERLGMGTPQTAHPRSAEEARSAAAEIGYPVFVKPSENIVFKRIHKRQAFVCNDADELEHAYSTTADYEPMVQEFIPGGDVGLWTLGTLHRVRRQPAGGVLRPEAPPDGREHGQRAGSARRSGTTRSSSRGSVCSRSSPSTDSRRWSGNGIPGTAA